jgi:hypothetical protein
MNKKEKGVFSMANVYVSRKGLRYFPEIYKNIKQLERPCLVIGKSKLSISTVFIVLAVVWLLSPLTASAQQWTLVCNGQSVNMYYDSNSVKYLPDNKVQVLTKSVDVNYVGEGLNSVLLSHCRLGEAIKNIKRNNNNEKYFYTEELEELNCKTNESRDISVTFYDKNGNILCKYNYADWRSEEETEWNKIAENNCLRLVYQAVCK